MDIGIMLGALFAFALFIVPIIIYGVNQNKEYNEKIEKINSKYKKEYPKFVNSISTLLKKYNSNNEVRIFYKENSFQSLIRFDKNAIYILDSEYYEYFECYDVPTEEEYLKYIYKNDKPINVSEIIIDYNDIKYFESLGSIHKEQHITGGGGGGSSLTGAVVGGLVAGSTGAIIGSRKKVEEIKTTYREVDDRAVLIKLNNNEDIKIYNYEVYLSLIDYIPQKEIENYINNKKKVNREK